MNIAEIRLLAGVMREFGLSSLSYEDSVFKLALDKSGASAKTPAVSVSEPEQTADIPLEPAAIPVPEQRNRLVPARVVGSVYRAGEPGKAPLVSVGSDVKKGDPLCVIEAMKIFSEITSPCDGTVSEILFADGDLAEFGQTLMLIEEPS